ncbi:MAG: hypothetical protein HN930_05270, partial [Pelagibacterales bacterium]|nr:hypothetical protein [Pelagibacterales bacterium]
MYNIFLRTSLLILVSIILCSSCNNKGIYSIEENIKELIEWTVNTDSENISIKKFKPVSSNTLAEMVNLETEVISNYEHNKGAVIGVLYFNNDETILSSNQKDLLFLISKAQKFEEFNILIESNKIKSNIQEILDQIIQNLEFNGVKNNDISLNHINDNSKKLIIK